jgi:hypothetical protein
MQIPVELVVFIAGLIVTGLGAMFSINAHLLIKILTAQSAIAEDQRILKMRFDTMEKTKGEYA